ncbi:hypothetical protein EOI86_11845 [Hwanghaeella grinnelliae]|uniref:VPLPA-CTERM sorting domain-containing protein n=1 Tax=Hwanghaeella grinnelliae TaxID=2500179 RepID=A0A3S2WR72_9PROT|nr:VPLPA-CTERM sorting domain-containing protein [Hwanghaeella grinnelliae]RVU35939.1 hypothetical protein EOI86_11845 [Hwanghaeella grinnelliae]
MVLLSGVLMLGRNLLAVFTACVALFSVSEAGAVTLRYSGEFTADIASGDFAAFGGQQGTYFFTIDYDAVDPDPTRLDGDIPLAVVSQGFSIGGETFVDSLATDYIISLDAPDFAVATESNPISSDNISDVTLNILETLNLAEYVENPLALFVGGKFGLQFGLLTLGIGVQSAIIAGNENGSALLGLGTITEVTQILIDDGDPGQGEPPLTVVPVPAALPLLISGIGALFMLGRRRFAA